MRNLSTGQWLTDWTPVQPITPGEYAITLVRGDIPALATTEATMEIQIRARDWFANEATVSRCWQHVPLAAPLRVGPAVEATGPGSLQAVDIDPDTYDLAMLINTTTEREIMWFEVANGTDDPVSGRHMAERYRALVPNPDVVLLEGIGHYPQVEDPDAVWRAFGDFVARRATPAGPRA